MTLGLNLHEVQVNLIENQIKRNQFVNVFYVALLRIFFLKQQIRFVSF
jgi:hypothetical protein